MDKHSIMTLYIYKVSDTQDLSLSKYQTVVSASPSLSSLWATIGDYISITPSCTVLIVISPQKGMRDKMFY